MLYHCLNSELVLKFSPRGVIEGRLPLMGEELDDDGCLSYIEVVKDRCCLVSSAGCLFSSVIGILNL